MKKLLSLITSLCALAAGWLQARRAKRRRAISEAIRTGDGEAVTKHHHDLLKLLVISTCFVATAHCGGGCTREKLVIVNEPMVPVRLEYNGKPGWWLSDSLYEATLLKLEEERND